LKYFALNKFLLFTPQNRAKNFYQVCLYSHGDKCHNFDNMAGKKLLVADDSLTIQKVIRLALSNEGYDIQAVSDGKDALQQIAVFRADVVLIDVSLPGKSAFEVCKEASGSSSRFVLMLSAFEKVNEQDMQSVSFAGKLTKPFDPSDLRKVLADVLAGGAPSPEGMEMPSLEEGPTMGGASKPEFSDMWAETPQSSGFPPPLETIRKQEADADIKHLTESTIRMSGLDDFQWSIKEPSTKAPASEFEDTLGLQESKGPGLDNSLDNSLDVPALETSDDVQLLFDRPSEAAAPLMPTPPPPMAGISAFAPPPPAAAVPPPLPPLPAEPKVSAMAISKEEMQELIHQQVQEVFSQTIQDMAKRILPDVAERIIKEEIRRLLAEQP